MKKLNKLQINSEKLMKNEELILLRGGYDVNFCGEGIDRWTCSCVDTYFNSFRASFCVPGGATPQSAAEYVEELSSEFSVNGTCW